MVIRLLKELAVGTVISFDSMNDYYDPALKEYRLALIEKNAKNTKEIEKCNLQRPSDEILTVNKHEIRKLKKGEYIKITSVVQFGDFLTVGYDDGLILVYQIEKQQIDKKPRSV